MYAQHEHRWLRARRASGIEDVQGFAAYMAEMLGLPDDFDRGGTLGLDGQEVPLWCRGRLVRLVRRDAEGHTEPILFRDALAAAESGAEWLP